MIGCPTGAIQRHPNGEVEINDNCIGCDNCARKCPYGNITMRPIPEAQQQNNIKRQAIKCNLCRGYKYSNCVHECPRGALLRVNPMEHFDELALVLAADQDRAEHSSISHRKLPKRSSRPLTPIVVASSLLLMGAVGISIGHSQAPSPYSAASPVGLGFGIGATACLLFALFLGARKKLSNHGLGRLETWTHFHMVIGALGFLSALAHADFGIAGIGTTLLMLLFLLEVLTGVAGQLLYTFVPPILTRIEKHGNSMRGSLSKDDRAAFESLSSMLSAGRFPDLIDFIPTWGQDTSEFRNVDPEAFALGTDGGGNYWLLCRDGSVQCWGHDEGGQMEDHNSFPSLAEAMECFVSVTAVREKHLSLDEVRPRFADREEGGWTWSWEQLEEWAEDEG